MCVGGGNKSVAKETDKSDTLGYYKAELLNVF
jgi:hypothetical protein